MRSPIRYFTLASALLAVLTFASPASAQFWGMRGTMLPHHGPGLPGPSPLYYSPMFRASMYQQAYRNPIIWGYPYIYRNLYSYPAGGYSNYYPAYSTPPDYGALGYNYAMSPFYSAYRPTIRATYTPPQPPPATQPAAKKVEPESVAIYDDSFSPARVTVTAGTTVRWINDGTKRHTITSDTGIWDSGELRPVDTFSRTFSEPGNYPYHCKINAEEMKGEIIVK